MKRIMYLTLITIALCGFTYQSPYNYHEVATLSGVVSEIDYEMPSGDLYHTFVLKLSQKISVNANDEWETKNDIIEVQLSIPNNKMLRYKNKAISVTGELFGAINMHHRREICIKVNEIESE